MNENLPPSLTRFAEELERALRRELGLDGGPGARRRLRAHPRLLAGTSLGVASAGAAIAVALTVASSSPAFAVTRNHDGTYSVTLKYIDAIPAVNKRLAGMRLRAAIVQVKAGCPAPWTVSATGANERRHVQLWRQSLPAAKAARIDLHRIPPGAQVVIPAWRIGHEVKIAQGVTVKGVTVSGRAPDCVPPYPPPPCPPPPYSTSRAGQQIKPVIVPSNSGNSGNSGPAAPGKSGERGETLQAPPPLGAGNSGNSGNSGNPGKSGGPSVRYYSQPGRGTAVGCVISVAPAPPPGGTSGNS